MCVYLRRLERPSPNTLKLSLTSHWLLMSVLHTRRYAEEVMKRKRECLRRKHNPFHLSRFTTLTHACTVGLIQSRQRLRKWEFDAHFLQFFSSFLFNTQTLKWQWDQAQLCVPTTTKTLFTAVFVPLTKATAVSTEIKYYIKNLNWTKIWNVATNLNIWK